MKSIDVVNRFFDAWGPANGYKTAIQEYLTADCVYENVGLSLTTGPAEALGFLDAFAQQLGFASLTVDMRAIVADGDLVLTERVDHLFDGTGRRLASLRVSGTFELKGGRISAWRDYFDSAALKPG
jgi:limonene-1,2-epoxide hydrolase